METPPPAWAEPAAPSRRAFLGCCAVLALAYTGCRSLAANSRSTYALIHDPHPDDYRRVVRGLMEAVLPFEHQHFPPVGVAAIEERLWLLFPFEDDERYNGLQKAFVLFDAVDLFPDPAAPIVDAEWKALDGREGEQEKRARDRALYEAFAKGGGSETPFHRRSLEDRRRYLRLWGESAFVVRRQFYRSIKALVMIAAYSHPALWEAIGYDGASFKPDPMRAV